MGEDSERLFMYTDVALVSQIGEYTFCRVRIKMKSVLCNICTAQRVGVAIDSSHVAAPDDDAAGRASSPRTGC